MPEPTLTPEFTPTLTPTVAPVTPVTYTVGLYERGIWRFRDSNRSGNTDTAFAFGPANQQDWQPVLGDRNEDGTDTPGLYQNGL